MLPVVVSGNTTKKLAATAVLRPDAANTITAQSASVVPLTLKAAASQSVDLLKGLTSGNGKQVAIGIDSSNGGYLYAGGVQHGIGAPTPGGYLSFIAWSDCRIYVDGGAGDKYWLLEDDGLFGFHSTMPSPAITVIAKTTDDAPSALVISGQDAYGSATGANKNGGGIYFAGGIGTPTTYREWTFTQWTVTDNSLRVVIGSSTATFNATSGGGTNTGTVADFVSQWNLLATPAAFTAITAAVGTTPGTLRLSKDDGSAIGTSVAMTPLNGGTSPHIEGGATATTGHNTTVSGTAGNILLCHNGVNAIGTLALGGIGTGGTSGNVTVSGNGKYVKVCNPDGTTAGYIFLHDLD